MTDSPDPASVPMLTDVIVPGRPPAGRPAPPPPQEREEPMGAYETKPEGPVEAQAPLAHSTAAPQPEAIPQSASASTPTPTPPAAVPIGAGDTPAPAFDTRDVEFIAERLRGRFSSYLREDARRVIEARCRDAIEEHTNWLVRQVTREVVSALEAEVAGWVRDAVREELARHTSGR